MKKVMICLCLITIFLNIQVASAQTLDCNDRLQLNSEGQQVKILQQRLNRIMTCNLVVDGIIGTRTQKCITDFQKKYNLEIDGIAGPQTCGKLTKLYKQELKKNYVVVTGDVVNIRNSVSLTDDSIKGTVTRGTVLRVYGTTTVDGLTWYKVYAKQNDQKYRFSYISADYAKNKAILVDINNQQLTYYYNGKIILSAPIITGKKNSHDTPTGKYTINPNNKATNATLAGTRDDGSIYHSKVSYWMPFIIERGIGFHDASWRNIDDYNKTTYIEDGSYGCINMRPEDAKKLYTYIKSTTYVIVK